MAFAKLLVIYLTPIASKLYVPLQNIVLELCAKFHVYLNSFALANKKKTVVKIKKREKRRRKKPRASGPLVHSVQAQPTVWSSSSLFIPGAVDNARASMPRLEPRDAHPVLLRRLQGLLDPTQTLSRNITLALPLSSQISLARTHQSPRPVVGMATGHLPPFQAVHGTAAADHDA